MQNTNSLSLENNNCDVVIVDIIDKMSQVWRLEFLQYQLRALSNDLIG